MALTNYSKMYVRFAPVVSGSETTVPTTWTGVLNQSLLTTPSEAISATPPTLTTIDKKTHTGEPVVTNTWTFNALNTDDATAMAILKGYARAGTLLWVQSFDTLATAGTVATGDTATQFQAYIGDFNIPKDPTVINQIDFTMTATTTNVEVTTATIA